MKSEIIIQIKESIDQRMQTSREAMQAAQNSANEESKSSAGDKYETARAMGQLDRDMHARQYEQARQERVIVERLDDHIFTEKIGLGSLVKTTEIWFFIAVSTGLISVKGQQVIVVSPQSPVGQLLIGKKSGDFFTFKGKQTKIDEIL
ncbi:hypothetical protein SAMN04515674_103140 [Pseudarcicella hirudinis]|uniref:Transcription elongation factor, GreA/GreB, C-term n=1 Tax=Pseudarcicella hirudinis TaxID=1079859 RepID=A0A1I5QDD9_9BACT|nr:transcription elongation factor [Pseudarcicella hirudinis]SFP44318.1 hypothetical protein SAMN04515674_103140 [Pseudarcicella hirudinis]